jgi:hypothetical protein
MIEVVARKTYWENGQLHCEAETLDGEFHGLFRMWHPNGLLACDKRYVHGVPVGIGRYWDRHGKEICRFEIVGGTGIERRPSEVRGIALSETPWVKGVKHGVGRTLDGIGLPMSECYWLNGKNVGPKEYSLACEADPSLPRPTTAPDAWSPLVSGNMDTCAKKILETRDVHEARAWLTEVSDPERTLGEDTDGKASRNIAEAFYKAGAKHVWVFDVNEADQNSGRLLVELPDAPDERKATLKVCNRWATKLGFNREKDMGQHYVMVMLD